MAIVTGNSDYGVLVLSGIANVKGDWVTVVPEGNVTEHVCLLKISIHQHGVGAVEWLMDIGTGSAGAESVIISNIPFSSGSFDAGNFYSILIPVSIPAGTRIAVRTQCDNGAGPDDIRIQIHAIGGALNSAASQTYGVSTASSNATSIDPGAVVDTKGAWTQLTASTTDAIEWLTVIITTQNNNIRTVARFNLDIGTGAGGSEAVLIPDLTFSIDDLSDTATCAAFEFPIHIDAGTRLSARGQSTINDAADRLFAVGLIGTGVVATNFGSFGGGAGWTGVSAHSGLYPYVIPTSYATP